MAVPSATSRFFAFVSHYKAEAAMEARFLKSEVQAAFGDQPVFLDSDDLNDLRLLKQNVINSDALLLIQSAHVLERPWCLVEIHTAIANAIPIVAVSLTTGKHKYDFDDAAAFLDALPSELETRNPGAGEIVIEHTGAALADVAWKLSSTLPSVISIPLDPSASRNILNATISDIMEAIRKAKPLQVQPRAQWEKQAKCAPTSPANGRPCKQPASTEGPAADLHHEGKYSA